jgi:hypothetical protein
MVPMDFGMPLKCIISEGGENVLRSRCPCCFHPYAIVPTTPVTRRKKVGRRKKRGMCVCVCVGGGGGAHVYDVCAGEMVSVTRGVRE